jgi:hypothetical protein
MKNYRLRVYDNFHYGDTSEAYDYGQFETYELALIAAKKMVESSLRHEFKQGISEDELLAAFSFYGDDPIIVPSDPNRERFSARDYAHEIAGKVCSELKMY